MSEQEGKTVLENEIFVRKTLGTLLDVIISHGFIEHPALFQWLDDEARTKGFQLRCVQHGIRGTTITFEKAEVETILMPRRVSTGWRKPKED